MIILLLVMVILTCMQLPAGIFSIFYHSAISKNSHKKADDLSLSFILGAKFFNALVWFSSYIIINSILSAQSFPYIILYWVFATIFLCEAFIFFFLYYRKGHSTALFISRRIATNYAAHCAHTKKRSDAFLIGFVSFLPELIFTMPLYIFTSLILVHSLPALYALIVIIAIIAITIPLHCIRIAYLAGCNLANIERIRTSIKPFIRFIIPLSFITIAIIIIINLGANYGF